jgi:hypothetical protein
VIRAPALVLGAALAGCGGAIARDSQIATQSAVSAATDPSSTAALDSLARSAASAARDELLGAETRARAVVLAKSVGDELRAEIAAEQGQLSASLASAVRDEVARLGPELAVQVRLVIREAIDEVLSEPTFVGLDAARERLVGARLRADLDAAVDEAEARLSPARAASAAAAAEVGHWVEALAGALAAFSVALAVLHWRLRRRVAGLEARAPSRG